jgi:uncharacterized membrane protein YgcG
MIGTRSLRSGLGSATGNVSDGTSPEEHTMTEETGDGGYTGNADGAGYTGYDPGPDSSSSDTPAPTPPPREIYDPPIEHDPIGQALVSLPFAAVTAVGEAAVGVATLGAAAVKEGVAWLAAEVGLGAVDAVTEGGSEGDSEGGSEGSGGAGGADGGYDGGAEGAGSE